MSRQHELRRDLHFTVGVVLEGGEVSLVLVGVDLLPVSVVSCRERKEEFNNNNEIKLMRFIPGSFIHKNLHFMIKTRNLKQKIFEFGKAELTKIHM